MDSQGLGSDEAARLRTLVERTSGLLVEGVNTGDVTRELTRPGGGILPEDVPGERGDRCVYLIEDYWWQSDSAPAGITTILAIDVLVFSKEDLLAAVRAGLEGRACSAIGTRLWDYGIWEDACPAFDHRVIPESRLQLRVEIEAGTLEVGYDQAIGPTRWTAGGLKALEED